ncbi:MAG TPA: helix-turn-helix domain-containing protein [Acidimicrobiia bacterium]|nr:helix-turn-helix domain-containing protein [Acidimicrobiia bacterium]
MPTRTPSWLTADEVADRLGMSLAEVYEAITSGRLPAQRYGNSYILRRADVDAFRTAPRAVAG